uniref:Uncharacterized protein n=1 Tax=Megaselia scalaris TaxID=36166 RepID=T1GG76_MEGSC
MSSPEGRKSLTGNNSQRIYTLGTVGFAIYLLTFSSFGIRTANALKKHLKGLLKISKITPKNLDNFTSFRSRPTEDSQKY